MSESVWGWSVNQDGESSVKNQGAMLQLMKCQQPLSFCFNMFQHSQSFTRYDAKIAAPNNYNTECRVLIENGDLDQEVPKDTIVEPWALWILRGSCGVMVTSSLFN